MSGTATVEIEITPPGPPGTQPWWTVLCDGTTATVRTVPGLDGDQPEDWGVHCTNPDHIQAWLAEGGTAYVVERMLRACTEAGASPRILAVHGTEEERQQMRDELREFADAQPGCSPELHRFAHVS